MGKPRPWLEIATLALGLNLLATPGFGQTFGGSAPYLRALGPTPLRYEAPRLSLARVVLPPLMPGPDAHPAPGTVAADPTNALATSAAAPTNAPAPKAVRASSPKPTPVSEATDLPESAEGPAAPAQPIDSQLLLQYLAPTSKTNAPVRANLVWPTFVPPTAPLPTPSSHATYERN